MTQSYTFKHLHSLFCEVWDVGGQDKIRPLWRHYYQNTQVRRRCFENGEQREIAANLVFFWP